MHNIDSLLYSFLKLSIFLKFYFLHFMLRTKPSYVWGSIFATKYLLHFGRLWRIGKGDRVNILQDNWIPLSWSLHSLSPNQIVCPSSIVSTLLIQNLNVWNASLVWSIFPAFVVETILSSFSFRGGCRSSSLQASKNRHYSVRSGDHLALNVLNKECATENSYSS